MFGTNTIHTVLKYAIRMLKKCSTFINPKKHKIYISINQHLYNISLLVIYKFKVIYIV